MAVVIVHQTGVQKFLSLPKYRDCVWSVIHTVFSIALIHTFCVFIGLVVYSQYKDCDPLTSHMVSKHDQLFPYFVADIGRRFPGVSGLSLAALCSAALRYILSVANHKTYQTQFYVFKPERPLWCYLQRRGVSVFKGATIRKKGQRYFKNHSPGCWFLVYLLGLPSGTNRRSI